MSQTRLLERMSAAIHDGQYSIAIERGYFGWVSLFMLFNGNGRPSEMG